VPKYDAFGREIGEDTLEGLAGEPASATPAEPPQQEFSMPQATAMPQFELPATGAPVIHIRRRSGLGCFVGLLILVGIVALPILAIVGTAGDAIDSITETIDSVPDIRVPEPPEAPPPPAKPPTGIAGRSMVAPANFGKALRRLDRAGLGRVTSLRLSPDRADAQFVKGRRRRSAQVDFTGKLSRSPATPGGTGLSTAALNAIDFKAPARLVRGSAARYGVPVRRIDYLVLTGDPIQGHRWVAYFKNGPYVQGDRSGRVVRRIS
jgi:hypothetical protein